VLAAEAVRLARLHRARQQLLGQHALTTARRTWGLVDAGAVAASWDAAGQQLTAFITTVQAEAARGATGYVATSLQLQGVTAAPAGSVPATAFAGVASDGRALESLLGYPAFEVQAFLDQGMAADQALRIGLQHLERIVLTQVQDAARISTGVAIVNDRGAAGYIRVTSPPSCSRCTILAGRWYRYNAGFNRHPGCDCVSAPASTGVQPESPRALFDAMTPEQRRKAGWSEADAKAIDDGADLYQVTNARRDLRSVSVAGRQVQTTGHGSGRKKGSIRLTPESIYSEAQRLGWSRDETIRALRLHGYIL
jgi:hypothetical protein